MKLGKCVYLLDVWGKLSAHNWLEVSHKIHMHFNDGIYWQVQPASEAINIAIFKKIQDEIGQKH